MTNKGEYWIYFLALVIGVIGMAIFLSGYHLYLDHRFVDDIRIQIQQQKK
jgi:hypothetical protein